MPQHGLGARSANGVSRVRRCTSGLGAAALAVACLLVSVPLPARAAGEQAPLPRLVTRIPLPEVKGRLDHLALDRASGRLFLAALGNGTIEVLDLGANRPVARLGQAAGPQGVLYLSGLGKLFVTDGEGASVEVFEGAGLRSGGHTAVRQDPDNIRDAGGRRGFW